MGSAREAEDRVVRAQSSSEGAARLAAQTDAQQMGEYLLDSLPYLMGAARRIAPNASRADHEDMVQSAITRLFELRLEGRGPEVNPRSYLLAIMRNAYLDAVRSPASRVDALEEVFESRAEEFSATQSESAVRAIELHREAELMRAAFRTLNDDYRAVLWRVVVEGGKPAELVGTLGRPAPAISSLLARAKTALRRAALVMVLSDGAEACRANAAKLPGTVHDEVEQHRASERGIAHVRECGECRRNWQRFAALTSALGLLPLLVVAARALPGFEAGPADVALDTSAAARPSHGAGSWWSRLRTLLRQPLVAGGLLACGTLLVAGQLLWPGAGGAAVLGGTGAQLAEVQLRQTDPDRAAPQPSYRFEAASQRSGEEARIRLDFEVLGGVPWRMGELRIELPIGASLMRAAPGWSCSGGNPAVCTPGVDRPAAAVFEVALPEGAASQYRLSFPVSAGDRADDAVGVALMGNAWGEFSAG